jgi:hypothetical protein
MSPSRSQAVTEAVQETRLGTWLAAGVLLLGAPAGLLWARLAPRVDVRVADDGTPFLAELESSQFFTVDLTFGVLMLVGGLGSAGLARRGLQRSWLGLVAGLTLGGLLAARVARAVGERVVTDRLVADYCAATPEAGFCTLFDGRFTLRAPQLVLLWAAVSLLATAVTLVRRRAVSSD